MKKPLFTQLKYSFILLLILLFSGCKDPNIDEENFSKIANAKPGPPPVEGNGEVDLWITNKDKSSLFQKQNILLNFTNTSNRYATIEVDTTQSYQTIDGFGYTLTGASAIVLNRMSATNRANILEELFAHDNTSIGVSYLRISIGASDLSSHVYSYDDMPAGQTDPTLTNFSIEPDRADMIPVLKEILGINPQIKILGTPWSPPTWMKTNGSSVGGNLKPEYFGIYADYLVKYLKAMQAEGINVDAITLQNEPLNPYNNPSMLMSAAEQAAFIKNNIGPALSAAGLSTKIILYDHNCDQPNYPVSILNDPQAKQYVDGSAFHLYGGDISALTAVHDAHPEKNIYFTEQYTDSNGNFGNDLNWHFRNLIIGAIRNWSRNVLEWNLAADPSNGPRTDGGCTTCLPAITVGTSDNITRNVSYYIIAHAAKFVRPGSIRIETNLPGSLLNVAFKNPDGKKVLIVLNDRRSSQTFNIQFKGKIVTTTLSGGGVGTFVW
ncbi:MAG TPA: glycoside hydrolase family 30 beta sandwich domain-containing protein [Cytophagales bacterium]|nr:glycoside hydrolase family 30 beta sandwich domain-containing protein [Cytophagales bacterium]